MPATDVLFDDLIPSYIGDTAARPTLGPPMSEEMRGHTQQEEGIRLALLALKAIKEQQDDIEYRLSQLEDWVP